MTTLIEARGLCVGYGSGAVVRDVDLEVRPGEVVALLGPNGAGKTTTLLALAGELVPESGTVTWAGSTKHTPLHRRARNGLGFVPEERSVFPGLTTRQNVAIARGCDMGKVWELFPELEPLMSRRGGLLSGGEQQMLAVGRALARPTKLLLADELSLGLAPRTAGRLLRAVRAAADRGMGALVVEQHVHRVLEIADRTCVMRNGRIELTSDAAVARERIDEIQAHYLSTQGAQVPSHGDGIES